MLNEESETKMCKILLPDGESLKDEHTLSVGESLKDKYVLSDEEILKNENAAKAFEVLSERYTKRVIAVARSFSRGGNNNDDLDDLIEEGLIALFRAIETYDETKGAKFSTYAYTCIRNRITDAAIMTDKHKKADDLMPQGVAGVPENDYSDALLRAIDKNLTKLERNVFRQRQSGMSYIEIAEIENVSEKSVDNAFYRAKSKLKKILHNME
jgi:RNA polymerase sporulation-specific sigma factor